MLMKSNGSRGAHYSESALMGGTVKGVTDLMIKNDQFVQHYNTHRIRSTGLQRLARSSKNMIDFVNTSRVHSINEWIQDRIPLKQALILFALS